MENASAAHPGLENSNVKTPKLRPCRVEKSNISDVGRHAASQISQRSRIQLTHPQLAFLLHNEAALFPDATRFRWLETQRCNVSSFWQKEEQRFFQSILPRSAHTNQTLTSVHKPEDAIVACGHRYKTRNCIQRGICQNVSTPVANLSFEQHEMCDAMTDGRHHCDDPT